MEMELTLLTETAGDAEKMAAVQRIRQGAHVAETMLRAFAAKFANESASLICVSDIAEQWMSDARHLIPESSIKWNVNAGSSVIQVRARLVRSVLSDLLTTIARTYLSRTIEAGCSHANNQVAFRIASLTTTNDRPDPFEPLLWSSLQHFAARDAGTLEHSAAPAPAQFVCSLTFPASSA
jgi:hypothetical protein